MVVRSLSGAQTNLPIFVGIPFAPGAAGELSKIELVSPTGAAIGRELKVLSRYPNGLLRVVLVSFRANLPASGSLQYQIRYGQADGIPLGEVLQWARPTSYLAMASPQAYADSTVFNHRFVTSEGNTILPAFETRMRNQFNATSNPPSNTAPTVRSYYDHVHAMYMALVRDGSITAAVQRIRDEIAVYRDTEIYLSGTYAGQFIGAKIGAANAWPIPFNIIRRAFVLGLAEDYYFTGDERSRDVARLMGEALLRDAATRPADQWTWTERIPGWSMMGLTTLYEVTLDQRYLTAAQAIANLAINHQDAMSVKYPSQTGVAGLIGGFIQDRNNRWFDSAESTVSGAGSPFMTTLIAEGLIRTYWLTGDARIRTSILRAADWLVRGCYLSASASYIYVCRDTTQSGTPALNPMFFQLLGFAYQATGDTAYLAQAQAVLAVNNWGNHIKEFNQGMHSSGQGLLLLQSTPGSVPLTLN